MIDFENLKIQLPGCSEVLDEMAAIQAQLNSINEGREELEKQLADKRKELDQARARKDAAYNREDRAEFDRAFDEAGKVRSECESLEGQLAEMNAGELKSRYEALRPKVYALESEANLKLEQAQKVVENRRQLRGLLANIGTQISKL